MAADGDAGLAKAVSAGGDQPRRGAASDAVPAIDLGETPGHLLRRAQQRAVELYQQAVGETGLRPPQFALLLTVYQNAGLNQTELVQRTGIDRSTLADMTARMEQRGLLLRRTGEDQRARRLWLTPEGESAVQETLAASARAQDEIMAPIPADKRREFLNLLRRIADLPPDPD